MGLGGAVVGLIGGSAVTISLLAIPFIAPAFRRVCIPYVPASPKQIENVKRLINSCPGPKSPAVDLGSGDGRIVTEMVRMGLKADGVELNGPLVLYSILNSYRNGTHHNAKFYKKNIFKADMRKYNITVMFGAEQMVSLLTPKLNEMKQESHLILCRFPLDEDEPNWKLVDSEGEGIDAAWIYKKITPSYKS